MRIMRISGSVLLACLMLDSVYADPLNLPDPLIASDGSRISDAQTWKAKRRPEILELFRSQVYGHSPAAPKRLRFEVTETDPRALKGLATRKQITIHLGEERDAPQIHLLLYVPNSARRPTPAFLVMNFHGNHEIVADAGVKILETWKWNSDKNREELIRPPESTRGTMHDMEWPVRQILERGYALATLDRDEIEPDYPQGWRHGIRGYFLRKSGQTEFAQDDWGAIGAWAWSLSRALDYLTLDRDIDARHVAVMGHSRLGKTALWAGAQDERFALVISNDSGEGGAALARHDHGETTEQINKAFPHWFCANYKHYNGKPNELPIDQHELIALMAPRPVYVASAQKDDWADPLGEFLSAKNAEPVYRLFGEGGLDVEDMPGVNVSVGDFVGYHIRSGVHSVTDYDWSQYMRFADRRFNTVESPSGVRASIDIATGRYEIASSKVQWHFAGQIGHAVREVRSARGRDAVGTYQELRFSWQEPQALTAAIRLYDSQAAVLFNLENVYPAEKLPRFPDFSTFPANLHYFSYKDATFAPPSFTLEPNGTPWLMFDDQAQAAILSPANHFMIARQSGDGIREMASGLNDSVQSFPASFNYRTLLVLGQGINATWDRWGNTLTALSAKKRPANDSDVSLRYLGYWTNNGAAYYYDYDSALGYAGTLAALVRQQREQHIPIRYLELDSWWYYKTFANLEGQEEGAVNPELPAGEWNRYGGLWKYEAHPAVFPEGLAAFQRSVGLPLITHNRWMDPESPYHVRYRISGLAAVDPRWWGDVMTYLNRSGVEIYEQDWLDHIYHLSPDLSSTVGAADAFTDGMARAAGRRGMTVQYSMGLPRYFLQSTRYDNVTTVRVSPDRFLRHRWDAFLYTSRLARSVGLWPWADVFRSTETENLMLAVLSGGVVGASDAIGQQDKTNLMRATRADGVLVKPDAPIVPADAMYLADATQAESSPMVAWTYTDHGPLRTAYVFVYNRRQQSADASFIPSTLGLSGAVLIYDPTHRRAVRQRAEEAFHLNLGVEGSAYYEIVPIGTSGIAFLGDEAKFISNGRKRIAALAERADGLHATVAFAEGEKTVTLTGYADRGVQVRVDRGSPPPVHFDAATKFFTVDVFPDTGKKGEQVSDDPTKQTQVVLHLVPE